MKKIIISLLLFCLMFTLCSCGEDQQDVTDPATDSVSEQTEAVSDTQVTEQNVSETETNTADVSESSTEAQTLPENTDDLFENATIPSVESYTLTAEAVQAKANFAFKGEKKTTQTCNKIVFSNDDGITQVSFAFAEDGSGMRVVMESPDGTATETVVAFNEDGDVSDITNGSGSYSNYFYKENQTEMLAYDADGALMDRRIYYMNEKGLTERVERLEGDVVLETYVYTANELDKVQSLRVENSTGYLLYEYTYNEKGELTETRIEQNNMFYGRQVYTYDEQGNRASYTIRNLEEGEHEMDITVYYNNVYAQDGTYLGTSEVDSASGKVYISVAYDYIETQYPHYADFVKEHYATY